MNDGILRASPKRRTAAGAGFLEVSQEGIALQEPLAWRMPVLA
jgi:hypothetical protein